MLCPLIRFPFGLGELYITYYDDHRLPLDWWDKDGEWTFVWGPWWAYFTSPSELRGLERRRIGPQLRLL